MQNILKIIISFIAYHVKLWHLLYTIFPFFKGKHLLVVLTFHRVIPKNKTKDFVINYDIGQDNKNYEMVLQQISKYFKIINIEEFINYVNGSKVLKQHSVLITFDDADYNFMDYALPILKENHWPAVIFAPTGYIETGEHFWHLRISNMVNRMDNQSWQHVISNKSIFSDKIQNIIDNYPEYSRSLYFPLCQDLIIHLNTIKDNDIYFIVDQFEMLVGKPYSLGIKCMDWEQLKILDKNEIMIESHSKTHRKLEYLEEEELLS